MGKERIFIFGGIGFILLLVLIACIAYHYISKRKRKIRPHISVATKSAALDNQFPPAPPPPPPPPHMTNGGIYRSHDPSTPQKQEPCPIYSAPPFPENPSSFGESPSPYHASYC